MRRSRSYALVAALIAVGFSVRPVPLAASTSQENGPEKIDPTKYSIGVVIERFKDGSKASVLTNLRLGGDALLVEVSGKAFGDTNASSDKRERIKAAKDNQALHTLLQSPSSDRVVLRVIMGRRLYEITFDGWDAGLEYEVAPWSEDKSIQTFKNRRAALPRFDEITRVSAEALKVKIEKEAKGKSERAEKERKEVADAREKARSRAAAGISLEERLLATIPESVPLDSSTIVFDPLGYRVAYSFPSLDEFGHERHDLVLGDKRVLRYQTIEGFSFSGDGAYVVSWGRTKEESTVIEGTEVLGPRVAIDDTVAKYRPAGGRGTAIQRPVISPDNRMVAYAVAGRDGMFIVIGDRTTEKFDAVGDPVFSPDGSTLAYRAQRAGKWYMLVGDSKSDEFDGLGQPVFSPDGKKVAYQAEKAGQRFSKQFIVIGSDKGEPYDEVSPPVFSRNGEAMAYSAKDGVKRLIVWGEKKLDVERGLSVGLIALSGDGRTLAYQGHQPNSQYVLLCGADGAVKKGPRFEVITTMGFNADGAVVYAATDRNKAYVITGDKQSEALADVKDLAFSPDRKTLAYCATNGVEWRVIEGDQKGPGFDDVWSPRFSPDGKKVGYGARKGRELWWKVMELK